MYAPVLLHPQKKGVGLFEFNHSHYLVFLPKPELLLNRILKRSFCWLNQVIEHYSKVCVVFLQLHSKRYDENNASMTYFNRRLRKALKAQYGGKIGIFWVRERKLSQSQHYHLAVTVSGHFCRKSFHIDRLTKEIWESINDGNFSYSPRNRLYYINRLSQNFTYRAAFMRLSYFAKATTKEQGILGNHFGGSFS